MGSGKVVLFRGIHLEVVEFERRFRAQTVSFPVTEAHRLLEIRLVDLEIERVVQLCLLLTEQSRQNGNAVRAGRRRCTDRVGCRRQKIRESGQQFAGRARLNLARPPGNEGSADAAFVKHPLVTTQPAGAAERLDAFIVGAVIRAEDDKCVVIDAEVFQLFHQPADVLVNQADHRGVILYLDRPGLF